MPAPKTARKREGKEKLPFGGMYKETSIISELSYEERAALDVFCGFFSTEQDCIITRDEAFKLFFHMGFGIFLKGLTSKRKRQDFCEEIAGLLNDSFTSYSYPYEGSSRNIGWDFKLDSIQVDYIRDRVREIIANRRTYRY